jgi:hypothetical protein
MHPTKKHASWFEVLGYENFDINRDLSEEKGLTVVVAELTLQEKCRMPKTTY